MKVLFIGDIVGKPGREAIRILLPQIKKEKSINFVIANAENASGGSGLTPKVVEELFSLGVHILTTGDHIWKRKDVFNIIDHPYLIRPQNLSRLARGRGFCFYEFKLPDERKINIATINLQGRVFMEPVTDCPFSAIKDILPEIQKHTKVIFVDFHAEATSEKIAMGWFLDGQVSGIFGTHTHIQTADEKILPLGSAYITDCGMTGPYDSVIGRKKEAVLEKFVTGMPSRFDVASSDIQLQGVVVEVDEETGKARAIERIQKKKEEANVGWNG